MEPVLKCINVTKKRRNFLLTNVNFELESGRLLGVIGENGAGKSTLMQLLLGGCPLDREEKKKRKKGELSGNTATSLRGDILVAGCSMRQLGGEAKKNMAYVLNECPFSMVMTAMENAKVYGECYYTWKQEIFDERLKRYKAPKDVALKKCSKRQQTAFQMAFAASYDAKVYIFDEPLDNLDVEIKKQAFDLMQELIAKGDRSVIYATRRIEDLERIGDYILWLDKGRQLLYEDKNRLLDEYRILIGSNKQLAYIEGQLSSEFLGKRITAHSSEALIRKPAEALPLKIESRPPTLKELMYYNEMYRKSQHKCFLTKEKLEEDSPQYVKIKPKPDKSWKDISTSPSEREGVGDSPFN